MTDTKFDSFMGEKNWHKNSKLKKNYANRFFNELKCDTKTGKYEKLGNIHINWRKWEMLNFLKMKEIRLLIKTILLFLMCSCTSLKHVQLGSTYTQEENDYKEYVLYNSASILPLTPISTDEKIGCRDNKVVYIQCENKKHYPEYWKKKISINEIIVEPGVGFYIEFPDEWYGFVAGMNEDLMNKELSIKYLFKKEKFSFPGDLKTFLTYEEFLNWYENSVPVDVEVYKIIIVNE